ncbi:MAG TPA: c-type cytochrome [Candidatus Acidoferrales bacterium]|jgi:cytochrome c553|nr:c-type cytochrome [Candidatus Acidoferrales bacterium]
MGFFHRIVRLFLFTCVTIISIALTAQDSNGQAPTPPSSTAQAHTAPAQREELPADLPAWAYGFDNTKEGERADRPDSDARGGPDTGALKHLAGSKFSFTLTQLRNVYAPADWYPEDHPPMPDIVAHGHKPNVNACSFCHYPNGKGRPVNTNLAGLPYSYILQVLGEFRTGARMSADTRKANTNQMIKFATSMTDDEMKDAARYFSSMKWTPWIRVVEASMVPKTQIANGIFLRLPGNEKEPIGNRIIETPEDVEAMEVLRDDRSGFIAYVPVGSVEKGATLVMTGAGGKTTRCTICHGADLMGMGPVPGLAGRSPSYLVRQLYDMRQGKRTGEWTSLMMPVVSKLTTDDMLAIAAYLASLAPSGSATAVAK